MPHYNVTVINTVYYHVNIIADNEEQAQDRALDLTHGVLQSDDRYITNENWAAGATELRDAETLKCRRCHGDVDWSTTPGYTYQCPECDEDLYMWEVEEK
jgi:hypothetical protein